MAGPSGGGEGTKFAQKERDREREREVSTQNALMTGWLFRWSFSVIPIISYELALSPGRYLAFKLRWEYSY